MTTLSISKAKSGLSRVVKQVIRSRKPVLVRAPSGYVQIVPYELPEPVQPWPLGTVRLTAEELKMHNTFGETL